MRGNVSRSDWLVSLCPIVPLPRTFAPHVVIPELLTPSSTSAHGAPSLPVNNGDTVSEQFSARRDLSSEQATPFCRTFTKASLKCASPASLYQSSSVEAAIIRHAGWVFSVFLSVLAWIALFLRSRSVDSSGAADAPAAASSSGAAWLVDVALGVSVCAVSSLASDAFRLHPFSYPANNRADCRLNAATGGGGGPQVVWRFFCGNFGMIMAQSGSALHAWGRERAVDALGVLERMAAISSERGGQSGGVVTFVRTWRDDMAGVRVRAKPAKRQSLSHQLISKFRAALFLNSLSDSLSFLLALLVRPFTYLLQALRLSPSPQVAPSQSAAAAREGSTGKAGDDSASSVHVFLGHTRFATSSVPSVGETHPHQWVPERRLPLWRVHAGTGAITCAPTNVGVYVTHNGDFEFWNLFGRDRTHSEMGPWLEVVLERDQPAQCDSVMIAGLMDLLRTHALWLPSIRLAFHQTVVMSYEEVLSPQASHPLPCLADLAPVAAAAERAMAHVVQAMQGVGSAAAKPAPRGSVTALRAAMAGREALLEDAILAALHSRPLPRLTASAAAAAGSDSDSVAVTVGAAVVEGEGEGEELSEEPSLLGNSGDAQGREQQEQQRGEAQKNEGGELPECLSGLSAALLQVFVRQAVANFLDNDLYWAAKKFLENAKGSFGMTTACTADCDRVVLAARNQPLALGFAPHSRTVLFSSESHSLLTPLSPAPAPAAAGRGAAGGGSSGRRIAYRVDLDESEGEVMEVVMRGQGDMVGAHGTGGGSRGGAANGEAAKGENGLADGTANGPGREQEEEQGGCLELPELAFVGVKLYSIKHNKPVTTTQFLQRKRLIPVGNNPFLAADDEDTPTDDLHAAWGPAALCSATPSPPRDLVEADLRAIPRVLESIRADWEDARSLNRRTAAALVAMLQAKAEAAAAAGEAAGGMSRKEIDVLVTGVETSLWVGEQFAADLQNCFPQLRVVAVSANKWALHVLETPMAWAISSLYIFIAVVFAVPIFTSIAKAIPTQSTTAADALLYTARALDALLFCFLPLIIALPLRILTGRDLLARLGKRTVVIADVPWVHQSLEVYVSKLFALSYWVAGLDVHGASPIDHLVHRFTHRVCRGTLLAFGRPDGRLCSQSRCESWVLMALLQARTIVSLGCGAEVITVGHNPYHARSLVKRHVVLPSNRPKFLCEKLLGVDDLEPMKRMATREHVVSTTTGKNPFETLDSQVVGLHLCDEGTVQKARKLGLSMLAHGLRDISTADAEDPGNREAILSALGGDVNNLLHSQAPIEDICENRFLSLERLIAFH
ncbi:unnamed protein product, partial [Closterium sp. Naga37s-1]